MEIKDKKLVSVLAGIIVILLIAVGALYFSTPKGGPQGGNPPTGMNGASTTQQGGAKNNAGTGTKSSTGTSKNSTNTGTKNSVNTDTTANENAAADSAAAD